MMFGCMMVFHFTEMFVTEEKKWPSIAELFGLETNWFCLEIGALRQRISFAWDDSFLSRFSVDLVMLCRLVRIHQMSLHADTHNFFNVLTSSGHLTAVFMSRKYFHVNIISGELLLTFYFCKRTWVFQSVRRPLSWTVWFTRSKEGSEWQPASRWVIQIQRCAEQVTSLCARHQNGAELFWSRE